MGRGRGGGGTGGNADWAQCWSKCFVRACDLQTNPGCQNAFVSSAARRAGRELGRSYATDRRRRWLKWRRRLGSFVCRWLWKGRGGERWDGSRYAWALSGRSTLHACQPTKQTYLPTTTMRKRIAPRIFCTRVDGLTAHVCECDRPRCAVGMGWGPRARARGNTLASLRYPTKRLQFKGSANNINISRPTMPAYRSPPGAGDATVLD